MAMPKAEATAELMLEVAQCFFRIRALARIRLITSWGGGAFGFIPEPGAAGSAHGAADRPDAPHQPSADAAAGR
jgi:hypothetical protein